MTTRLLSSTDDLRYLSLQNTYFIIRQEIYLENKSYALGERSVIEFDGGSLNGSQLASLNLNGGQIIAEPYSIFHGIEVIGFSNIN